MSNRNPFQQATKVSKKLKVLIYGGSGTGKTLAGLTFPRPAVVDSENGTDLYAGRDGVPTFSIVRAKTFDELQKVIEFIKSDNGKTFDTLVIDSMSVFYDVQKEAASKSNSTGDLGFREWGKINNRMVYLYNALTNLPVHVVVTAREAIEYETRGKELVKVGTKPDADKRLVYMFDFIIRMTDSHEGDVIKSRGAGNLKRMSSVNWQAFMKIADMFTDGDIVQAIDENAAAQRDAIAFSDHWSQSKERVEALYKYAFETLKATREDVNKAIDYSGKTIEQLSENAAAAAVKDYIAAQGAKDFN